MDVKCLHCKSLFVIYPSEVALGYRHCCSRKCHVSWRQRPAVIIARFWKRVAIGTPDECWEWFGGKTVGGYGHFEYKNKGRKVQIKAHRFAYTVTKGKVPRDLLTCHTCDNPSCCNPAHLFIGTHHDNSQDMVHKGRHPHGISHSSAKMDDTKVRRVFRLSFLGYSWAYISRKMGISSQMVWRILKRKSWQHVEIENYLLNH